MVLDLNDENCQVFGDTRGELAVTGRSRIPSNHRSSTGRTSKRPRGCSARLPGDVNAPEQLITAAKPHTGYRSAAGLTL